MEPSCAWKVNLLNFNFSNQAKNISDQISQFEIPCLALNSFVEKLVWIRWIGRKIGLDSMNWSENLFGFDELVKNWVGFDELIEKLVWIRWIGRRINLDSMNRSKKMVGFDELIEKFVWIRWIGRKIWVDWKNWSENWLDLNALVENRFELD